ncbi:hypothetical protein SASPL_124268 [Salvia splendens]|uniref:Xyloglucan endotransglucosylase/hydrolase n=1 Tax=Salvia splendens TaxID=180675 RepID=A0A8X8XQ64_SALSN|nr:hypothetical protein SASPL_124268 [Salvia splendens]
MDSSIMATKYLYVLVATAFLLVSAASAGNFNQDVSVTFGGPRTRIFNGGQLLTLSLDNITGCGFESKKQYLFARFDVQLKLIPGDSAGTVTTFYLSSLGANHDEIDFEFLGNASGQPYTIHTNVYTQGVGNREQQFRPCFMVDNMPIRVFNNYAARGVPFPTSQPMRLYASLWNADDWATQGGRVKTDWTKAPFTASYQNYNAVGCVVGPSGNSCNGNLNGQPWQTQGLDANGRNRIRWIQEKYMIYNYCSDVKRFPQGRPRECRLPRF